MRGVFMSAVRFPHKMTHTRVKNAESTLVGVIGMPNGEEARAWCAKRRRSSACVMLLATRRCHKTSAHVFIAQHALPRRDAYALWCVMFDRTIMMVCRPYAAHAPMLSGGHLL